MFFEDGGLVNQSGRLTTALLSATPESGKMTPDLKAISDAEALTQTRNRPETCQRDLVTGNRIRMRTCLEADHRALMRERNDRLFRAGW